MDISRGLHGITFEAVRTFHQERLRAEKLLTTAADALVWRKASAFDREVHEELDTLQLIRIHTVRGHRLHQECDQG